MLIKKDDNIIVITGKDKGKTGKVTRAFPRQAMVLIQGFNKVKRHQKARRQGKKGEIVEKSLPMHVSNVMLVDPKTGKRTRVGKKNIDGIMVRIARKSGIEIK